MTSSTQAIQLQSGWMETMARVGYAAKGVVYVIIGVLSTQAAFNTGGQATGSKGAFATVLSQPFGKLMLGILVAGMAAYAAWRYLQAFKDTDNEGSDGSGLGKRFYAFVSGVLHTSLVYFGLQLLGLFGGGGGGGGQEHWISEILAAPFGRWLVALLGAIVIGAGVYQLVKAYKVDFTKRLDLTEMSASARRGFVRMAQWALTARGVVFGVIGLFMAIAGLRANPALAKGVGEALKTLENQPFGPWLLGFVGIGLGFYGLYQFVKARYRIIHVD